MNPPQVIFIFLRNEIYFKASFIKMKEKKIDVIEMTL